MPKIKVRNKAGQESEFESSPSVWESIVEGVVLDADTHKKLQNLRSKTASRGKSYFNR